MKKNRVQHIAGTVLAAVTLFIVVAGLVFRLNNFKIVFSERDGKIDTVECGGEYAEPRVKARLKGRFFYRSGKEIKVKKAGAVNTAALGTYSITWSAAAAGIKGSVARTVDVVDTTPPVITLTPYEKKFLYVKGEYVEPGFKAEDSVDGDITSAVVSTKIDTLKPGVKKITYTVADKSGNSASVTREITVKKKPKPKPKPKATEKAAPGKAKKKADGETKGVIFLTFDDGPGRYTAHLLDVLAKYNVKATFFVTGGGDRSLIAREAKEGHAVGIHSLTHNYAKIYKSEAAFFKDINAMNAIIKKQTGSVSKLLRFPGGSSNMVSRRYCRKIMTRLTKSVEEKGFKYFDWNVLSGDAGGTTSTEKVYSNVINGVRGKPFSIVLQHDIKGFSVNAVEKIIKWGKNNGYTFKPLTVDSPTVHQHINN